MYKKYCLGVSQLMFVLLFSSLSFAGLPANFFCGNPDASDKITASDALNILKYSVGQPNTFCEYSADGNGCECDVNGDGAVRASDALIVLKYAVGAVGDEVLNCKCEPIITTTTTTSTSTSTSTSTTSTTMPDYYDIPPKVRFINREYCDGYFNDATLEADDSQYYPYYWDSLTGFYSSYQQLEEDYFNDFLLQYMYVDQEYPCSDISFNGTFYLDEEDYYTVEFIYECDFFGFDCEYKLYLYKDINFFSKTAYGYNTVLRSPSTEDLKDSKLYELVKVLSVNPNEIKIPGVQYSDSKAFEQPTITNLDVQQRKTSVKIKAFGENPSSKVVDTVTKVAESLMKSGKRSNTRFGNGMAPISKNQKEMQLRAQLHQNEFLLRRRVQHEILEEKK